MSLFHFADDRVEVVEGLLEGGVARQGLLELALFLSESLFEALICLRSLVAEL